MRAFETADETFDFIAEVIRGTKHVEHPTHGADYVKSRAEYGDMVVYEYPLGQNKLAKKLRQNRWRTEMEKRGFKQGKYGKAWE